MERTDDLIQRGWNLKDSGNFDRALDVFNEALETATNASEKKTVYVGRGLSYMGIYEYELAIKDFEAALKIDPNYAAATRGLKIANEKLLQNPIPQKAVTQTQITNNQIVKKSNNYNNVATNDKTSKYPLMNFSRKFFMVLYEIGLWIILVGTSISSSALFGMLDSYHGFHVGLTILGFFIGLIVGLVLVGLSGGLVAVFLRMAEDIEKIKQSDNRKN